MEVKEIKAFRPPCDASSEMVNVKAFLDAMSEFLALVDQAINLAKTL